MKANNFEAMILDQSDKIERCFSNKNENLIMDWINDINEDAKKTADLLKKLSFDRWMRKIKNIHYSDNESMEKAYRKIN